MKVYTTNVEAMYMRWYDGAYIEETVDCESHLCSTDDQECQRWKKDVEECQAQSVAQVAHFEICLRPRVCWRLDMRALLGLPPGKVLKRKA